MSGKSTIGIAGRKDTSFGSAVFPIYQTSTFRVERSEDFQMRRGEKDFYIYSRHGNPTLRNIEEKLALLEGAEEAVFFSSGMAAVSSTLMSLLRAGDTVAASSKLYGTTFRFLRDVATRYGVRVAFLPEEDLYRVDSVVPEAKVVYFETPVNPTTHCLSIERVVSAARKIGAVVVMDNTFASPINKNPIEWGVDVVVHSATKYIAGHSDLLAGAAATTAERAAGIAEMRKLLGGSLNAVDAFFIDRSLKTLEVRVRQHNENAQRLAEFLEKHPAVKRVFYPGLPSSPSYGIASRQMKGFGGMLCMELENLEAAKRFCDSVKLAVNATSLGGVESLVSIPVLTSHFGMSEHELREAGVTPGMVRVSVGLENIEDILEDFSQALRQL